MLRSCFVVRFGFRVAFPPELWPLDSSDLVRALSLGCVPRGQRAPLDADTYALIDQSTRLVQPSLLFPCLSCLATSMCGAESTVDARDCPLAMPCREALSELLAPSCSCVVVLDDCCEHTLAQDFAFFPLLEVLSIVLGEWLKSKMQHVAVF